MKKPTLNEASLATDFIRLQQQWPQAHEVISQLRKYRSQQEQHLKQLYQQQADIVELIRLRSLLVDNIIQLMWQHYHPEQEPCCLMAVGGYGRRELLPYSDIDLYVITPEHIKTQQQIESFIAALWDIGLKVSHSVCSVSQCQQLARGDVGIMTSLLECRCLCGSEQLYEQLSKAITPKEIWSSHAFLKAKQREQIKRHEKFGGSSYNLEPNVKEGPGGLRDIQTVMWIGKRHFGHAYDKQLVSNGYLTAEEYQILQTGQRFLWNMRCALHYLVKRQDERLLFDYQTQLAQQFGYRDRPNDLAIEQFMKTYYRTVKRLNELNDMLIQLFREEIVYHQQDEKIIPLNERFQIHNDYIEVTYSDIFERCPSALLEIYLLMVQHPEIKGVRASTIRLIRKYHHVINDDYHNNPDNQQLFIALFKTRQNISAHLRRMSRYGVLDHLIPSFKQIIGRMQYDLFHVYTVDQHLLSVVNHVYLLSQEQQKFPLCHELMQTLADYATLYLAALFHDMGKGQGGDHSELGAHIVKNFCATYGLANHQTELLAWLVENHLLMSNTAQRQDIYDPQTVMSFAKKVGNLERLNHLYLLTVADICGTNPNLWNSWRDTLLRDLYHATKQQLEKSREINPAIVDIQAQALMLLNAGADESDNILSLWSQWGKLYFLRTQPKNIAKHTLAILNHQTHKPLILISNDANLGVTEIFIYISSQNYHFATTTVELDRLNINIMEAQIATTKNHYKMDIYYITDQYGHPITQARDIMLLKQTLEQKLKTPLSRPRPVQRHMSRRLKHFNYATKISFQLDAIRHRTNMEVITPDRAGLLARISMALVDCKILLQGAKIATMGERVEDVFFITDQFHQPLTEQTQQLLKQTLCQYLDQYR